VCQHPSSGIYFRYHSLAFAALHENGSVCPNSLAFLAYPAANAANSALWWLKRWSTFYDPRLRVAAAFCSWRDPTASISFSWFGHEYEPDIAAELEPQHESACMAILQPKRTWRGLTQRNPHGAAICCFLPMSLSFCYYSYPSAAAADGSRGDAFSDGVFSTVDSLCDCTRSNAAATAVPCSRPTATCSLSATGQGSTSSCPSLHLYCACITTT
jgi:hypothetical protein